MIAESLGFDVFEMNASTTRNAGLVKDNLAQVAGCGVLNFGPAASSSSSSSSGARHPTRRVIVMDEVDGMSSGDRGGTAALITVIKESRTPIICICNDRQANSVKSLVNHCYDLRFIRPTKEAIAKRCAEIAKKEGLVRLTCKDCV